MPQVPDTRASLILRLPSAADAEAWNEFVSIYEPFVYRFARRGGLQEADARELVQNVLLAVARAVGRWRPDSSRGKFRTWLFRIARNQLIDLSGKLRRHATTPCCENSLGMLAQPLEPLGGMDEFGWSDEEVKMSHRRELFRWAAERVKTSVKLSTWQAFWLTAVEQLSAEVVAERLSISVGAVYIARSRVLARLRDAVNQWEEDDAL